MQLDLPELISRRQHPQVALARDILALDSAMFNWESAIITEMVRRLRRLWAQIAGELVMAEGELAVSALDHILGEIKRELDRGAGSALLFVRQALKEAALGVAEYSRSSLRARLGRRLRLSRVKKRAVHEVVDRAIIVDGSRVKDLFDDINQNAFKTFRSELINGVTTGKKTHEMIKGLKGFFGNDATRRTVEHVIRTASNAISNQVRKHYYASNPSLVTGTRAIATLDLRTTKQCRARNNKVWSLDSKPIGHSIPYNSGAPWHWQCRTAEIPEINDSAPGLSAKTRAAFRGPVPGDFETEDWIKALSERDLKKYFGSTLLPYWRDGRFTLDMYLDSDGNDRTIAQIVGLLKAA